MDLEDVLLQVPEIACPISEAPDIRPRPGEDARRRVDLPYREPSARDQAAADLCDPQNGSLTVRRIDAEIRVHKDPPAKSAGIDGGDEMALLLLLFRRQEVRLAGRPAHGEVHFVQNDRLHIAVDLHVLVFRQMNQVEGGQLLRDHRFVGVPGEAVDPAHQVSDALDFGTLAGDRVQVIELAQPCQVLVRRAGIGEGDVEGRGGPLPREGWVILQKSRPLPPEGHVLAALAGQGNDIHHGRHKEGRTPDGYPHGLESCELYGSPFQVSLRLLH